MKTYRTETTENAFVDTITCNKCRRTVTRSDSDIIERQEFMCWRNVGGYGSIFGDGVVVELDLCQHCIKEVLGGYIREVPTRADESWPLSPFPAQYDKAWF